MLFFKAINKRTWISKYQEDVLLHCLKNIIFVLKLYLFKDSVEWCLFLEAKFKFELGREFKSLFSNILGAFFLGLWFFCDYILSKASLSLFLCFSLSHPRKLIIFWHLSSSLWKQVLPLNHFSLSYLFIASHYLVSPLLLFLSLSLCMFPSLLNIISLILEYINLINKTIPSLLNIHIYLYLSYSHRNIQKASDGIRLPVARKVQQKLSRHLQ